MGTNLRYMGEAGCGQHTKMVNQILIATNMVGFSSYIPFRVVSVRVCCTAIRPVSTSTR